MNQRRKSLERRDSIRGIPRDFTRKNPPPASPAPDFLLNPRSISTEGKNGTQHSERLGAEPS